MISVTPRGKASDASESAAMADATPDPLAPWRDLVSQWEKGVNTLANSAMASDQFSGTVNTAMGLSLRMQQKMGEMMATYLTTLNLPSKADITAMTERLAAIEARLEQITTIAETAVRAMPAAPAAPAAAAPMPPRTKKPPASTPAEPSPKP